MNCTDSTAFQNLVVIFFQQHLKQFYRVAYVFTFICTQRIQP